MPRSFFERLTGSIRLDDESRSDDSTASPAAAPPSSAGIERASRFLRKRAPNQGAAVIHPTASEEPASSPAGAEEGQLTVDIWDDGENILVQSFVGGVRPEDIDVSLQEDTLTVRGARKRAQEVSQSNFYYRELFWGTFSRSIILPQEVDFTKAEAALKGGLLTVKLPKKDKGEKKITVKVA